MKKSIYLSIGFLLLFSISLSISGNEPKNETSKQGEITIQYSPDLYELTNMWYAEYGMQNPDVKIALSQVDNANFQPSEGEIALVSESFLTQENAAKLWEVLIGRETFVLIMNEGNPFVETINQQGISKNAFASQSVSDWGALLGIQSKEPINVYVSTDESTNSALLGFFGKPTNIKSAKDVVGAVQIDNNAIGFCKLTDIIDKNNLNLVEKIRIIPVDKNENGKIDYLENIYADLNSFSRGVWIGKYPKNLVSNIYAVSIEKPTNAAEVNFVKWLVNDGQQILANYGICQLVNSERQSALAKLTDNQLTPEIYTNDYAGLKTAIILILLLLVISILIRTVFLNNKFKKDEILGIQSKKPSPLTEKSINLPAGLFFDKSHTWAFMEQDGSVKIGIDDFIPKVTGKITEIKMVNPGDIIKKGDVIITLIQKGKQLHIKSPISGTIKTQNESLQEDASLINISPYSKGWVYQVEPKNWLREVQFMFMSEKFKDWLKNEFIRLKDFFAISYSTNKTQPALLILQEGGELPEGILEEFGPVVWEDFQAKFIEATA
ncbi:MAG TPA: hypothetical protein VIN10_01295 [Bacteroidales bacterium]